MNVEWSWRWVPVHGDFGSQPLWDTIRLLCVVEAGVLLMVILRTLREGHRREDQMSLGRASRFVALALAGISLALTEIAVLGTAGTPRLFFTVAVLSLATYGTHHERVSQRSQTIRG